MLRDWPNFTFGKLSPFWNSCSIPNSAVGTGVAHWCGQDKPYMILLNDTEGVVSCGWQNRSVKDFTPGVFRNAYCSTCPIREFACNWMATLRTIFPCILRESEAECSATEGCGWCEHYCMNTEIHCGHRMFNE